MLPQEVKNFGGVNLTLYGIAGLNVPLDTFGLYFISETRYILTPTAEPIEAKVCVVVGLQLFQVVFICPASEGGRGAAYNFNCPGAPRSPVKGDWSAWGKSAVS